jgi:hypothetical protein
MRKSHDVGLKRQKSDSLNLLRGIALGHARKLLSLDSRLVSVIYLHLNLSAYLNLSTNPIHAILTVYISKGKENGIDFFVSTHNAICFTKNFRATPDVKPKEMVFEYPTGSAVCEPFNGVHEDKHSNK